MIVTHGWPGSIIEQLKIIGPLTDPTAYGGRVDAFDVVIPRFPATGSPASRPARLGSDPDRPRLGRADAAASATTATSRRAATGATPSPSRWRCRRRPA